MHPETILTPHLCAGRGFFFPWKFTGTAGFSFSAWRGIIWSKHLKIGTRFSRRAKPASPLEWAVSCL